MAIYRDEIEISLTDTPHTTTFEIIGQGDDREFTVQSWSGRIDVEPLLDADIVHLGPVANEIDLGNHPAFPDRTFVGLTPQGWMRRWNNTINRVELVPLDLPEYLLQRSNAMVVSKSEFAYAEKAATTILSSGGIVALTKGELGCEVHIGTSTTDVGAIAVEEIDDTGAGDIFAASFFVRLSEGQDPIDAARFANCAAALSVRGPGLSAIATRSDIEARLS